MSILVYQSATYVSQLFALECFDTVPFADLVLPHSLAIQAAGVSRGRNGFRKDKGGEKLVESEEDLLQHRTDWTDAFDTLYIGCEKFPFKELMPYTASGVM